LNIFVTTRYFFINNRGMFGVSGFPFPREPGTRLKNRFCVFSDIQMSGYSLSSILEQVTTCSRIPKSENPSEFRISGNENPRRSGFQSSSERRIRSYLKSQVLQCQGTGFLGTKPSTNSPRHVHTLNP
jgi:hypothetical protein